uniref:Caspase family p20 domain-containing protein n=2 Tax=Stomoxys calcitrans TaxID=35570 RepID=A0A1I8Q7A0_STOCA
MDHTNNDCIAIIISTHGERGDYLHAYDKKYYIGALFQIFTPDNCPTLAGKPKLFFIQACRGRNCESGVAIHTDSYESSSFLNFRIPLHADFLVAHSTVPDCTAYRSISGSAFLRILSERLQNNNNHKDLVTLLTLVNREIALELNCINKDTNAVTKQMPCFTSTLMHILRFN